MSIRTTWQDLYGMQIHNGVTLAVHLAADPTYVAATKIGIQGTGSANGKFALPLTDHPNFKAPSASLDTEQARGISPRHNSEFHTVETGEGVEFTLPLVGHSYNVAAFLPLLFQSGASEAAHVGNTALNYLTCIPYVDATVSYWSYFTRSVQAVGGGKDIDLQVEGGVVNALTLSGETGGVLTIEAAIKAAKWSEVDLSTATTGLTALLASSFDVEQVLKFQDCVIAMYNEWNYKKFSDLTFDSVGKTVTSAAGGFSDLGLTTGETITISGTALNNGDFTLDGTPSDTVITVTEVVADEGTADAYAKILGPAGWVSVKAPAISFTITNNVIFNYYNDDVAVSANLGKLAVEGSITVPFSQSEVGENYMIKRFLEGEPVQIAWYWGQSAGVEDILNDYDLNAAAPGPDRFKNDSYASDPKNYLSVVVNARVTDYEMAGDNELMVECTLTGVTDADNAAVNVFAAYDETKLDRLT